MLGGVGQKEEGKVVVMDEDDYKMEVVEVSVTTTTMSTTECRRLVDGSGS